MKRMFDIFISLLLLICFFFVILLVAIIVKTQIGSPILFRQQRPGLHGKSFYLYKFRTMTNERNRNGELLQDHARLTKVGKFLRKYSLDELPQLINVLKGQLSLVGPRPLLIEYMPLYSKEQAKRHNVRPGITGWAQVNGRNSISWDEKFKLDVWYVENQSFLLDLKILYLTFSKVLKSEGITNNKHVTMPVFKGGIEHGGE
ncbi:sugar transferase [Bacillus sp. RC252]|uniref:sugar transferase n=1 Tax=Bacillus sp. RC252 TaxID=3156289 RepID=UPI0038350F08